jgi:Zn-finger nucleic acid-binding protein
VPARPVQGFFVCSLSGEAIMEKSSRTWDEVELKYCERCGGLWLRRKGSERVYCVTCVPKVADLPEPRRRAPRLPQAPKNDIKGGLELFGIAEGGWS